MENKQNDNMHSGQQPSGSYDSSAYEKEREINTEDEPNRAAGVMSAGPMHFGLGPGLMGQGGGSLLQPKAPVKQSIAPVGTRQVVQQDTVQAPKEEYAQPKAMGSEYLKHDVAVIDNNKLKMTPKAVEDKILEIFRNHRVRYRRKHEDFRATGSYVFSGEICEFECQLWTLKDKTLGLEFRRKGTEGRHAYRDFVQVVAWGLKEMKMSNKFASGSDILMPLSLMELKFKGMDQSLLGFTSDEIKDSDDEDYSDLEDIPGPPSYSISFLGAETGIRLEPDGDILKIWKNILASENYNHKADTLKVMTRAARKPDNAKVLAADRNILSEVSKQLKELVGAQVIHSASELLSNIVTSGEAAAVNFLTSDGIVEALINVALTFTGSYSKAIGIDDAKKKSLKKLQANSVVAQNAVKTISEIIKKAPKSIPANMKDNLMDMHGIVYKKTAGDTELENTLKEFQRLLTTL